MKIILTIILTTILALGLVFGQNHPIKTGSDTELLDFSKKNLNVQNSVELFPNPTTDFLMVSIDQFNLKQVEFRLYNIIGNKLNIGVDELSRGKYRIDVRNYNPGYYLLVIRDPIMRYNKAYKFQKK